MVQVKGHVFLRLGNTLAAIMSFQIEEREPVTSCFSGFQESKGLRLLDFPQKVKVIMDSELEVVEWAC